MKKLFGNKYRIASTRLPERDYRNVGAYFVTFNIQDRQRLFGHISDGEMILSDMWVICQQEILRTGEMRDNLEIDTYIVMPDHVHILLMITDKITKSIDRKCNTSDHTVETPRGASLRDWWSTPSISSWTSDLKYYKNRFGPQPSWSLSVIVNQIKWSITRRIRKIHPDIWFARQSRYYERIIRDEKELDIARQYVLDNPLRR